MRAPKHADIVVLSISWILGRLPSTKLRVKKWTKGRRCKENPVPQVSTESPSKFCFLEVAADNKPNKIHRVMRLSTRLKCSWLPLGEWPDPE